MALNGLRTVAVIIVHKHYTIHYICELPRKWWISRNEKSALWSWPCILFLSVLPAVVHYPLFMSNPHSSGYLRLFFDTAVPGSDLLIKNGHKSWKIMKNVPNWEYMDIRICSYTISPSLTCYHKWPYEVYIVAQKKVKLAKSRKGLSFCAYLCLSILRTNMYVNTRVQNNGHKNLPVFVYDSVCI